jgi:hypothetical protein
VASSFSPLLNVTSWRSVKEYRVALSLTSHFVASHGENVPSGLLNTKESTRPRNGTARP